jgi:hypothetical protein
LAVVNAAAARLGAWLARKTSSTIDGAKKLVRNAKVSLLAGIVGLTFSAGALAVT